MAMKITGKSRKRIEVDNLRDFTGGLNLSSDTFKLKANESPDMLNVDVDYRGGFQLRRGLTYVNSTALGAEPSAAFAYRNSSGTNQLLVQVGNDVVYNTGSGNFTSSALAGAVTGPMRAAVFNDLLYIQRNREQVVSRWNGTAHTALTANAPTWQDSLLSPTGGFMPTAKCIAVHMGYVWVANTKENGTVYPNRLRWSHPNRAEDWRANDYVDVDLGKDGDQITAIFPMGDHLVVCKRNSMYAVYGYSAETFSVVTISNSVGCVSQEAGTVTPYGLYVFDPDQGIYIYDGRSAPRWEFENIFPAMRDGTLPSAYSDYVMVGWVMGRLWVSVPWSTTTTRARTFVLDPSGKGPSWTAYDIKGGPYVELNGSWFSGHNGSLRMHRLEQDQSYDDYGSGQVLINSYYTTGWIDARQPSQKKRWKRMEAVLIGGQSADAVINVEVFSDYDRTVAKKNFQLTSVGSPTNVLVWGSGAWDDALWGPAGTAKDNIDRGAAMGMSKAVAIKFNGPQAQVKWGVDHLAVKYIRRPVR